MAKGTVIISGSTEAQALVGATTVTGALTVGENDTGHDVTFYGATSGSYMTWDESADTLILTDSTPLKIGDASDMTLYHDATNSYITNAVGALKIATETSGIAVTIGHGTSEVTVADNLTVAGNISVSGTGLTNLDAAVTINDTGADVDFRIESNNEANMFFIDGGTDKVGIGTNAVAAGQGKLTVYGNMQVTRGSAFGTLTTSAWAME